MKDLFIRDIDFSLKKAGDFNAIHGKKIMIAGATGQIGCALVYALLQLDSSINIIAHGRNMDRLNSILSCKNKNRIEVISGDICQGFDLPDDIDVIINATGYASPEAFRTTPSEIIKTAIKGTEFFLEYLRKQRKGRYVFVSSAEVYAGGVGDNKTIEEKDYGYIDVLNNRNCYPMAKRAAENLCEAYLSEHGVDYVIARPSHIYGPTFQERDNSASVQFLKAIMNHRDIILYSEGAQPRSYTYVTDCASGILAVAARGIRGEAYNVSSDSVVTIKEFANICANICGRNVIVKNPNDIEFREKSPVLSQVLSNKKIKDLSWNAYFDIHSGIIHTINILKEKYDE